MAENAYLEAMKIVKYFYRFSFMNSLCRTRNKSISLRVKHEKNFRVFFLFIYFLNIIFLYTDCYTETIQSTSNWRKVTQLITFKGKQFEFLITSLWRIFRYLISGNSSLALVLSDSCSSNIIQKKKKKPKPKTFNQKLSLLNNEASNCLDVCVLAGVGGVKINPWIEDNSCCCWSEISRSLHKSKLPFSRDNEFYEGLFLPCKNWSFLL